MEVLILLALYFLPAVIASMRSHHQGGAIFLLNLLLGWTAIGWLVALIWSATATPGATPRPDWRGVDPPQPRSAPMQPAERPPPIDDASPPKRGPSSVRASVWAVVLGATALIMFFFGRENAPFTAAALGLAALVMAVLALRGRG